MRKILLVEDDALLNRTLTYNLTEEGYQVTPASRYREAVQHIQATEFDLALLDVNLPDGSGLDLCQEIRGRGQRTYLMFLTANDREADILQGYEAGGGDYVTKPFSLPVLCRKIAAVFDHLDLHAPRRHRFDDGVLALDFSAQTATLAGAPLDLAPKEFRLLALFVKHPGILLTKGQILEQLWDIDGDFVDGHTPATLISRIRKKIETGDRKYIKTVYGIGYQWVGGEAL